MYKIIVFFFAMVIFMPLYVRTDSEIQVKVDGNRVELEQPPMIIEGRVFVPMREVFEAMGYNVVWDGRTQTISLSHVHIEYLVVIGRNRFRGPCGKWSLNAPAKIINGRAMLPLCAIPEVEEEGHHVTRFALPFNATAQWNEEQRLVNIYMDWMPRPAIPGARLVGREPFTFFVISPTEKLEQMQMSVYTTPRYILANWANLNNLSDIYVAEDGIRYGKGAGAIGWLSPIRNPVHEENYFVLYLSRLGEPYFQDERGLLLLEALESTLRGFYYFGDFEVKFVDYEWEGMKRVSERVSFFS